MAAKLRPDTLNAIDIDSASQYKRGDIDYRVIHNPYVIIIGIDEYKEPNKSLDAVKSDIKYMKELWINKFKYKNVSVANEVIGSSFITAKELHKYLNKSVAAINLNENCDSLILIYSGHGANDGVNNYIICSDNNGVSLTEIYDKFSTKHGYLENKPKIMYIDCCRGQNQLNKDEISTNQMAKGNGNDIIYVNKTSDIFVHFSTCNDYKAWTKNADYGSYLIHAMYECYTKEFVNHITNFISLNETSLKINGIINQNTEGTQTAEICHRLIYDVYIKPDYNTDTNIPQSRQSLQHKLIEKEQEIKSLQIKLDKLNEYVFQTFDKKQSEDTNNSLNNSLNIESVTNEYGDCKEEKQNKDPQEKHRYDITKKLKNDIVEQKMKYDDLNYSYQQYQILMKKKLEILAKQMYNEHFELKQKNRSYMEIGKDMLFKMFITDNQSSIQTIPSLTISQKRRNTNLCSSVIHHRSLTDNIMFVKDGTNHAFRKKWTFSNDNDSILHFVKNNCIEWKDIVESMKYPKNKILSISRIQNVKLWSEYINYSLTLDGKLKETKAWYGTVRTDPFLILSEGFDRDRDGINCGCLWYATDATYAMNGVYWQHPDGLEQNQLFLCLVAAGNANHVKFIRNNKVLNIYNDKAVYPAYLVTYSHD